MDDTTEETTPTTPRLRRFLLRWIACTFLIAGVFLASRLTAHPIRTDNARSASQSLESEPTEPGETDDDSLAQREVDGGDGDLLAVLSGIFEDLLGGSTAGPSPTGQGDLVSPSTGWTSISGSSASGGDWSMTYPAEWEVDQISSDVTMFSAPDYQELAVVLTRQYSGPLKDEASTDLDELLQDMPDGTVVSFEDVDFDGREAVRAGLGYTNPYGQLAAVSVVWIHDGATLYVIAGEAGVDQHTLQATVDEALNSFTISEPV